MAVAIQAGTPLAEQLSSLVQPKLVDIGWSSGGLDDSALAEYIILMLVNGKTQDQIASELSNDLLSLPPEDTGAQDFAQWLFEQVNILTGNGPAQQEDTHAIPSFTTSDAEGRGQHLVDNDAEMIEAGDGMGNGNIPTGPKSMRGGRGGRGSRLAGQLNRAMDRNDVLHRVRPQTGERINTNSRLPPKGPRSGSQNRQFGNGVPTGPKTGPANRGPVGGNSSAQFTHQQQAQLFNMLTQLMGGQMNGMATMNAPAVNSNFRGNQGNGRPLADRINGRQNGNFHGKQNGHRQPNQNADGDVSMDGVENTPKELGPETVCKFNLKCTKADCIFAHQSPAAPPGTTIDVTDTCTFGAACQNKKCVGRHPSPAQKKIHQAEQECKFFPNCTNPHCPFKHPNMPLCRNGADCKLEGCKFTHLQTPCRFNPCKNPTCPYKHEEGQQQVQMRTFADMTWTPDKAKEHVSERKFISEDGQEELIVPSAQEDTDIVG